MQRIISGKIWRVLLVIIFASVPFVVAAEELGNETSPQERVEAAALSPPPRDASPESDSKGEAPAAVPVAPRATQPSTPALLPPLPPSLPAPYSTPSPQEGLPLYLMNREGRLIAVPGVQLEYLDELLRSISTNDDAQKEASLPDFLFHSVLGEGRVEKDVVRLKIRFQVETFRDYPVCVPLRFNQGILPADDGVEGSEVDGSETAVEGASQVISHQKYRGSGKIWVEFQEQEGFTAWISGKGTHEFELTFLVPYERSQMGEKQMRIQFPYATMSELDIAIPLTREESQRLAVSITGGASLQSPLFVADDPNAQNDSAPGVSRLTAIRLGGEFWLSWNLEQKKHVSTSSILEAEGLILANVEKDEILYDARLKLLCKGDEIGAFRVRLPENAEMLPSNTQDYSVVYLKEGSAEEPAGGNNSQLRQVVEIRLKKRTTGLIRVDIRARRKLPGAEPSEWFDLSGFEVLSAVRQSGHYAVKIAQGKHAHWSPGVGVRRLEKLPFTLETWLPVLVAPTSTTSAPFSPFGEIVDVRNFSVSLSTGEESSAESKPGVPKSSGAKSSTSRETFTSRGNGAEKSASPRENAAAADAEASSPTKTASPESLPPAASSISEASNTPPASNPPPVLDEKTPSADAGDDSGIAAEEPTSAPQDLNPYLPSETSGEEVFDGVFEYISQPAPLLARIITRTTRVNIEPKYVVVVTRDELHLEATWNCTIRGGKIGWVDIDLGDWTFESAGAENLVALDLLEADASGRVSIPFLQPTGGHALLTFRAKRKVPESETQILMELPRPAPPVVSSIVMTSTPAELKIEPASNIELAPVVELCSRLSRQPSPLTSGSQDSSWAFHYRCESEDAVFAAIRNVHKRSSNIRQYSQVEIYRQEYRVRQTFEYTIAYESVNQLRFAMPAINPSRLDIQVYSSNPEREDGTYSVKKSVLPLATYVEGDSSAPRVENGASLGSVALPSESPALVDPVAPAPVSSETSPKEPAALPSHAKRPVLKIRSQENGEASDYIEVDVLLPEERIGTFSVVVSYSLPMGRLEPGEVQPLRVHLATPLDGTVVENLLETAAENSIRVASAANEEGSGESAAWEELGALLAQNQFLLEQENGEKQRNLPPSHLFKAQSAQRNIVLDVELKDLTPQEITIIDRCWLQTWLAGSKRQDRAVFLFPPIVDVHARKVLSDAPAEAPDEPRTFTIRLPEGASADEVEVWIDRRPAQFGLQVKRIAEDAFQVMLSPTEGTLALRTVEVRYQFEQKVPLEGRFEMEFPYVEDATWIRGVYWQLLLPSDTHIFTAPKNYSMEYRWGWSQCFWGRLPMWEQSALESWSGAIEGTPVPMKMNRYVFAGMGANEEDSRCVTFFLINRTALVIGLGVLVFWVAVLFMYFPFLRRPISLLFWLTLLGGCALWSPELALLGLQAATFGLILFLISMLCGLSRLTNRELRYTRTLDDESTQMQIPKMVITPSGPSQSARTETFEQGFELQENASTVVRKK
ncbi:MAG: hypothetical protein Q4D38_01085 [Planctomycetia bacterium]|nr:hypothetical protein [Planctomycetia bacterium]